MKKAILQADVAFKNDEVPVGAIVVDNSGQVLSRAYNKVEQKKCQSAHAEIIAIQSACKAVNDWRLDDCTMYITLEPCLMCLGLIKLSRIKHIVFGAKSPIFGAMELNCGPKCDFGKTYTNNLNIEGGVCVEACTKLLQDFFIKQRKKKGK